MACINKINNSLQRVAGVTESQAWLEDSGGKARVQYGFGSDDDVQEIALKLADAIRGATFDSCSMYKIQVKP